MTLIQSANFAAQKDLYSYQQHFNQTVTNSSASLNEAAPPPDLPADHPYYYLTIEDLGLPPRTYHVLKAARIDYVGQLVQHTEADLLKYRNSGKKTVAEIAEAIEKLNTEATKAFSSKTQLKLGMGTIEGFTTGRYNSNIREDIAALKQKYNITVGSPYAKQIELPETKFPAPFIGDEGLFIPLGPYVSYADIMKLKSAGILYIGDILPYNEEHIEKEFGVSKVGIKKINAILSRYGLALETAQPQGWPPLKPNNSREHIQDVEALEKNIEAAKLAAKIEEPKIVELAALKKGNTNIGTLNLSFREGQHYVFVDVTASCSANDVIAAVAQNYPAAANLTANQLAQANEGFAKYQAGETVEIPLTAQELNIHQNQLDEARTGQLQEEKPTVEENKPLAENETPIVNVHRQWTNSDVAKQIGYTHIDVNESDPYVLRSQNALANCHNYLDALEAKLTAEPEFGRQNRDAILGDLAHLSSRYTHHVRNALNGTAFTSYTYGNDAWTPAVEADVRAAQTILNMVMNINTTMTAQLNRVGQAIGSNQIDLVDSLEYDAQRFPKFLNSIENALRVRNLPLIVAPQTRGGGGGAGSRNGADMKDGTSGEDGGNGGPQRPQRRRRYNDRGPIQRNYRNQPLPGSAFGPPRAGTISQPPSAQQLLGATLRKEFSSDMVLPGSTSGVRFIGEAGYEITTPANITPNLLAKALKIDVSKVEQRPSSNSKQAVYHVPADAVVHITANQTYTIPAQTTPQTDALTRLLAEQGVTDIDVVERGQITTATGETKPAANSGKTEIFVKDANVANIVENTKVEGKSAPVTDKVNFTNKTTGERVVLSQDVSAQLAEQQLKVEAERARIEAQAKVQAAQAQAKMENAAGFDGEIKSSADVASVQTLSKAKAAYLSASQDYAQAQNAPLPQRSQLMQEAAVRMENAAEDYTRQAQGIVKVVRAAKRQQMLDEANAQRIALANQRWQRANTYHATVQRFNIPGQMILGLDAYARGETDAAFGHAQSAGLGTAMATAKYWAPSAGQMIGEMAILSSSGDAYAARQVGQMTRNLAQRYAVPGIQVAMYARERSIIEDEIKAGRKNATALLLTDAVNVLEIGSNWAAKVWPPAVLVTAAVTNTVQNVVEAIDPASAPIDRPEEMLIKTTIQAAKVISNLGSEQ